VLPRVLETEAMDTLEEAVDYDAMDHGEVNRVFVADLLAASPPRGEVVDLGTGTAQIPIELCRRSPAARVLAIDAAAQMIEIARRNVAKAGLSDRIRLEQIDAKRLPYRDGTFAAAISNSIVHHVPRPREVLAEAWRIVAPGGLIFFRDLLRPDNEAALHRLVDAYAAGANQHQRQMLADSLHAALTVEEIGQIVAEFGQPPGSVRATSDRHWTWAGRKVEG